MLGIAPGSGHLGAIAAMTPWANPSELIQMPCIKDAAKMYQRCIKLTILFKYVS